MAIQVGNGTVLTCTIGAAPSTLLAPPLNRTLAGGAPAANITDFKPILNILPFGMCMCMCMSMANPMVVVATAAAMDVLTPIPCVPLTVVPWTPGVPMVMVGKIPTLDINCKYMCTWAGVISITSPGQFTVMVH
jgi:hypothetical protein